MNALDPHGAPLLELMLDFYDYLLARSPSDRDAAFKQSCNELTQAIVSLRQLPPEDCADWLVAIGERFQVENARRTVQEIILLHINAYDKAVH